MRVRLWVALGAPALGVSLLLTAQLAGAARGFRQGGIFRYGEVGASVQIDPQLAYVTTAWWLEYATAARLFNYPDRPGQAGARLVPEVASGYTVSRDGRTWTFTIRKGFRFSDGSPVTGASFKYAIERAANHDLASPGAAFITDPSGTNIVGAKAVNDGRAAHVRGVVVRGNRLIIRLTRPDGTFLTKLALPFFQATSKTLPRSHEVLTSYPSAARTSSSATSSTRSRSCGATRTTAAPGRGTCAVSTCAGTWTSRPVSTMSCRAGSTKVRFRRRGSSRWPSGSE